MTFVFPRRDSVVADIVLIAWRRVDTLRACLESLLAMNDAPPFGLRIVANGATEEVREFLRSDVDGAVIVERAENIGFGGGCNAAAAGSAARYLVFLNDDTVVEPHWLSALVAAAEAGGADAFASVLLDAEGRVAEAGARILADTNPIPWGAGLAVPQARALGLLEPRQIDYGSAAALLVDRQLFERLGGFDLGYSPAYYEDVDLCFRITAAGKGVRLVPTATVTHYTGASTRTQGWFLQFAVQNARSVFAARWRKTLASAPSIDAPVEELVAVDSSELTEGRGIQLTPGTAESPTFALRIARTYSRWLEVALDDVHGRIEDFHRGQLEAEAETERIRQESLHSTEATRARAQELHLQIDSLISANPVNVLRWWLRARRARR